MKIELTDENMIQVCDEESLIVNGEEWEFVEETDYEYDENGHSKQVYYEQPSTGKIFMVSIYYSMIGYEDYEFDIWMQDKTAYEVEKVIVKREEWKLVE